MPYTNASVNLDDILVLESDIDRSLPRKAFVWGYNGNGELGLGNITHRSSPVQLGSLTDWKSIDISYTAAAVKTDGTLWTWGNNTYGSIGDGTSVSKSSPVQVGLLTDWVKASVCTSALGDAVYALKSNGTLWAWGENSYGQLGNGSIASRSSPVQIGALTNWKTVPCGMYSATTVKTDGTLWAWGFNQQGSLGTNDQLDRSSPVQVGTLTNWAVSSSSQVATLAVKTDGTLWTWGNATLHGAQSPSRSSPVQLGTLTNWAKVYVFCYQAYAIKTDGTLWSWGSNLYGELGLGDTANRSSPTQVGSLTNWQEIINLGLTSDASFNVMCPVAAIKTDGTIWSWGYNIDGELGIGTIAHKSSPVQIGSLNTWAAVYIRS